MCALPCLSGGHDGFSWATRRFSWDTHQLICHRGHVVIMEIFDFVKQVAEHQCFGEALKYIETENRSAFKQTSNIGAVWTGSKRGWQDIGNWKYVFFYQFIYRVACRDLPEVRKHMDRLAQTYELLHYKRSQIPEIARSPEALEKSRNLKGDVIEVSLFFARETGPSIQSDIRIRRNEYNRLFVKLNDALIKLFKLCFASDVGGAPTLQHLPDEDVFVKLIWFASLCVTEKPDAQAKENFQKSCAAFNRSVGSLVEPGKRHSCFQTDSTVCRHDLCCFSF